MAQVLYAVVGATFTEPLTLTDRDGTPTDLTGAAITWLAKRRVDDDDDDAVITATTANGRIVIVDPVAGGIRFSVPASVTALLEPRGYAWTLQVHADGQTTRYPDSRQGGPGRLLVAASAVVAVP